MIRYFILLGVLVVFCLACLFAWDMYTKVSLSREMHRELGLELAYVEDDTVPGRRVLLSFATTLVMGTVSVALMFKSLPEAIVSWKDVIVGAFVTALLLIAGANILGSYLASCIIGSAFETAGTVAVLLVAVYFLAQFLVFGTVFTRACANTFGNGIRTRLSRVDALPGAT